MTQQECNNIKHYALKSNEFEKERQIAEEPGDGNPSEIQASGDAMRSSCVSSLAEPPLLSATAHTLQLSR